MYIAVETSDCDCEEEAGNYNNTVHGDSGLLLLSREGGSKHHPPASIHHGTILSTHRGIMNLSCAVQQRFKFYDL